MKIILATTVAALALTAGSAQARSDDARVEIRDAVARVVVIVEDRADVSIEIDGGSSGLARPRVTRDGDRVRIDGGLRNRIRECRSGPVGGREPGQGASVEVRDHGRVELSTAPLIVIRSPRAVSVTGGGATFGTIGRGAASVEMGVAGCGDWTVANVDGPASLSIGGSGSIRAGTSRSLAVNIGGAGEVTAGSTGDLEVAIGGSGDVTVARVNGDLSAAIGGSGDVRVPQGEVGQFEASVAGSGGITFGGRARDAEVSLVGSGDVRIRAVTGNVQRNIVGGGTLTIANRR